MEEEFAKARSYTYGVLATRRQTEHQLEKRLRKKGYSDETVKDVLNLMKRYKYIDDKEYTRLWIRQKRLKRGCSGLKWDLLGKGVDARIIDEVLAEFDPEEEYDAALNLAGKKIRLSKDACSLQRLSGFLQRRGFSYEVIGRVCRTLRDKQGFVEP